MILEIFPKEQRLTIVNAKDENDRSALFNSVWYDNSRPESLKMILELYPPEHRLEALQEKDWTGRSVLFCAAQRRGALKIILELLPEDMFSSTQTNQTENNIIEYAFSIEQFVGDMVKLRDSASISKFLYALIKNQGIKEATQSLFTVKTSSSFFSANKNSDIQKCIDNLDPFWKNRVNTALGESSGMKK
jgi:hypothetical protein